MIGTPSVVDSFVLDSILHPAPPLPRPATAVGAWPSARVAMTGIILTPEELSAPRLNTPYPLTSAVRRRIKVGKIAWGDHPSELADLSAMLYPPRIPAHRVEVAETASAILSCTGEPLEACPRAIQAARTLVRRGWTIPDSTILAVRASRAAYAATFTRPKGPTT